MHPFCSHPTLPPVVGHTIVFGNETGVDLWGNISLGKDDITNNWLSVSGIIRLLTYACLHVNMYKITVAHYNKPWCTKEEVPQ